MKRYRARWVYTGDGPPLENATIEIENGRVHDLGVGPSDAVDLGNVAIIPGLINAHTHLEFSTINAPLEPLSAFPDWILEVIRWRNESEISLAQSIQAGLEESLKAGVTSVAEIATSDWRETSAITPATNTFSKVLIFREYLGLADENVNSLLNNADDFLQANTQSPFVAGLSPHAPYSLHPELFEGLCRLAESYQVPLAMHLAESPAEIELLQTGKGPLAEMLKQIGLFRAEFFSGSQRPIHYLRRLDCGVPTLIVHGNLLNEEELKFIANRPRMSVVYCPRTHATMQVSSHPWLRMVEMGINVAIGTDSRASNPDLSVWNELHFLARQHPKMKVSELIKFATVHAAKALNLAGQGSLFKGCESNLCLIPLDTLSQENPEEFLLKQSVTPVGVMTQGEWHVAFDSLKEF